jgi:hypothetical protein
MRADGANQVSKAYLTETEVSAVYGIGVKQLRHHRMRGDGPRWQKISGKIGRPGGRVVYSIEAVRAWIESQPGGGERQPT